MPEPESRFYWQAYHHLRGSRQIGFGIGPIPFAAIMEYADFAAVTCPVERNSLVRLITAMDNAERDAMRTPAV